jgi:hypothetical protein
VTLWHFKHCLGESGVLPQWAHVGAVGCVVDDDESVVDEEDACCVSVDDDCVVAVCETSSVGVGSAMFARCFLWSW